MIQANSACGGTYNLGKVSHMCAIGVFLYVAVSGVGPGVNFRLFFVLRVELGMEDYGTLQKSPSCMVEPLPVLRSMVFGSKVLYSKLSVSSRARHVCFGLVRYSLLKPVLVL